ncbi:MAG: di-heme oxidoredictase family protein [Planctomycetota bacterium]
MKRPAILASALLVLAACHGKSSVAPVNPTPPTPTPTVKLGDPLPDLTTEELAAFERGKVMFTKRFTPSEGLGPFYNATSCASCHSTPVVGGGADLYRNFYLAVLELGATPEFQSKFPTLPSPVMPAFGTPSSLSFTTTGRRFDMPQSYFGLPVTVAQRNSIPIFGTGLFEFVSNATILSHADPDDADHDGISGRTNSDGAGMGRFGVKAQSNNVEFFTRAPLMNQMGITSNPFRGSAGTASLAHGMAPQASSTPNAPTTDNDGVPDPEISAQDLGDLIAFSRFLAPPAPLAFDESATRGQAKFEELGCAKCHIPELPSSRGPVRAYTDLLIHDMGSGLADNITFGSPQASATSPNHTAFEFRTAPLWGVSHFPPYLHNGSATTLDDAIRAHGGESQTIRDAYVALPTPTREDILVFLRHL